VQRGTGLVVLACAMTIGTLAGAIAIPLAAQAPKNVWDGIYSDEQAARGKKLYIDNCSACHQEGLQGADLAPALKGETFVLRWAGFSMQDMLNTISTTMPADAPGKLMPQANTDVAAFILQVNKFPAGRDELKPDAAILKEVAITATKP
jgi:cytochrome c